MVRHPSNQGEKAGAFFGGRGGYHIGASELESIEAVLSQWHVLLLGVLSFLPFMLMASKPKLYFLFIICLLVARCL
jgi:hypothetical protein